MSDSEQIRATRTVAATPAQVFALLCDPSRHPEVDGSSMIRGLADGETVTGVGDTFTMDMNNPVLGDYQVRSTITAYDRDRRIGWAPLLHPPDGYTDKLGAIKPGGHTYTWELEPDPAGGTAVTHTYDWSGVGDPDFKARCPVLNADQLAESIDRVGRAAQA